MITLFGQPVEVYQAVLLVYAVGYGLALGIKNTFMRFISLFGRGYRQNTTGQLLDALWYGCIFILVGVLS